MLECRLLWLPVRRMCFCTEFLLNMPIDNARTKSLFRKLERLAGKLVRDPQPDDVHQFRRSSRRIEAVLHELVAEPGRSERKLLKQLARSRKRAGQIRDLDVQATALRSVKLDRDSERKRQLLNALTTERQQCEKKLSDLLDDRAVRGLRKRLRRAAELPELQNRKFDPVSRALRMFVRFAHSEGPLSEATLHPYRLHCKRVRYIAEMAGKQPEAKPVVDLLKAIQDAIGEWHDWDVLTSRAQKLFADTPNPPLLTALHAIARTRMNDAIRIAGDATSTLLQIGTAVGRRKPARAVEQRDRDLASAAATA